MPVMNEREQHITHLNLNELNEPSFPDLSLCIRSFIGDSCAAENIVALGVEQTGSQACQPHIWRGRENQHTVIRRRNAGTIDGQPRDASRHQFAPNPKLEYHEPDLRLEGRDGCDCHAVTFWFETCLCRQVKELTMEIVYSKITRVSRRFCGLWRRY